MPTLQQWLEIQYVDRTEKRNVVADTENPQVGIADGSCPGCTAYPFLIQASAPTVIPSRPDTIRGNGYARCCGDAVGYVYAKKETLFGLEEDRAVLEFGRARVYGRIGARL